MIKATEGAVPPGVAAKLDDFARQVRRDPLNALRSRKATAKSPRRGRVAQW